MNQQLTHSPGIGFMSQSAHPTPFPHKMSTFSKCLGSSPLPFFTFPKASEWGKGLTPRTIPTPKMQAASLWRWVCPSFTNPQRVPCNFEVLHTMLTAGAVSFSIVQHGPTESLHPSGELHGSHNGESFGPTGGFQARLRV